MLHVKETSVPISQMRGLEQELTPERALPFCMHACVRAYAAAIVSGGRAGAVSSLKKA